MNLRTLIIAWVDQAGHAHARRGSEFVHETSELPTALKTLWFRARWVKLTCCNGPKPLLQNAAEMCADEYQALTK